MRVAVLYDIHGNLPALEAVLAEIDGLRPDCLIIGGDVLPGPMPVQSLERLRNSDIPTHFISGNGEREVLAWHRGITTEWMRTSPATWTDPVRWSAEQIDDSVTEWIASWPATLTLQIDGIGPTLFCHASPRNDTDIVTIATAEDDLQRLLQGVWQSTVICGHTHMPYERSIGTTRLINAGSVGMPFGPAGADWLWIADTVQLRHTDYDTAEAADRVRRTEYPQRDTFADHSVVSPPSAEQMLKAWQSVSLHL